MHNFWGKREIRKTKRMKRRNKRNIQGNEKENKWLSVCFSIKLNRSLETRVSYRHHGTLQK